MSQMMGVVNDLKNQVGDVVKKEDATMQRVVKIQNSTEKLVDNVHAVEKKVYICNPLYPKIIEAPN